MNDLSAKPNIYDTIIRMLLLALITVWCLMIIQPFMSIILWSFILGMALLPLHRTVSAKLGNKPKLASILIISTILVVVIAPLAFLISSLVDEVMAIKATYFANTFVIPMPDERIKSIPVVGSKIYDNWALVTRDEEGFLMAHKDKIIEFGGILAKGILAAFGGIIQLLLSLGIAGVLLVRTDITLGIRAFFNRIAGDRGDAIADLTVKTVGSVLNGVLGEGFVMAMLYLAVFVLAGVPYFGFLTLLVFIFAIVQVPVGLVSISVSIYLLVTREPMPAIFWSALLILVSLSDNILTPLMLGKGAPVPMLVIFMGVLGGFVLSGFVGLFTGAIVLSVGYELFTAWMNSEKHIVQDSLVKGEDNPDLGIA